MNLVVLDGHALNPGDLSWDCLHQFGDVTVYDRTEGEALTISRIGSADVVLLNKTPITEAVLSACPSIKLICVLATGYNVLDCEAAARRGIPVCNVPGYGTAAVAQFTFALLLELCHRVGLHNEAVHRGDWSRCPDFCFWNTPQMELAGKTMGILGFGSIGRSVGRIARAFGMEVIACSRSRCAEGESIGQYVNLQTLLAESDVISLHCPLFPETRGIIDAGAIARMKDGAILLNTARGPLVAESAVAAALRTGKLRGYCADVVSEEPIRADSPLLTAPNCILTPHMAWAPVESRQRILDATVNSIRTFRGTGNVPCVNLRKDRSPCRQRPFF